MIMMVIIIIIIIIMSARFAARALVTQDYARRLTMREYISI
jgi:hypothetical protein